MLHASRYREVALAAQRDTDSMRETVEELNKAIARNNREHAAISENLADSVSETRLGANILPTLDRQNVQLKAELAEVLSSREELRLNTECLRESLAVSEDRVKLLENSVVTLSSRNLGLESSREELRVVTERLRESLAVSEDQGTHFKKSVVNLEDCNAEIRRELEELESSYEQLKLDNDSVCQSLATSASRSRQLARDFQSAADHDHLTIRDLRNNLRSLSRELIAVREKSRLPKLSGRSVSDLAKRQLHLLLDVGQRIIPEFLRRPVRNTYLNLLLLSRIPGSSTELSYPAYSPGHHHPD